MQFTTPRPERMDEKRLDLAHLVSLEGIPWHSRNIWDGRFLTLERPTRESGTLVCPWQVAPGIWRTVSSASLMERDLPYCLPVELCRGALHRLRERAVAWQNGGHPISERCRRLEAQALRAFVKAAMNQGDVPACDAAVSESLQLSFDAIEQLLEDVAASIGAARRQIAARIPPFLGGWLGAVEFEKRSAGNLVRIPLNWGAVAAAPNEFNWGPVDEAVAAAERVGCRILLGPLIRWSDRELPSWLGDEVKTFEDLSTHLAKYVRETAQRYEDRAMVLEVADRVSRPTPLGLDSMQQLQLLSDCVRAASTAAPALPRMVTIGLPFGETMSIQQTDLSPLHFADYLLRSETGLSAIGLEISCGDNSLGYPPRDPLDVARLLERWAILGQPLLTILHVLNTPDGNAETDRTPESPLSPARRVDSPSTVDYVKQMIAVSFANTSVQGVLWCPEDPSTGEPCLEGGEAIAEAFRQWKDWLGC